MPNKIGGRNQPSRKMKFATIVFLFALVIAVIIISNPLRRPSETIEANLLEDIPIGTSLVEVRLYFIKDENVLRNERNGIIDLGDGEYWQKREFEWDLADKGIQANREDGGHSYRAGLGGYIGFPWTTFVEARMVFDANQKLKYLRVSKWQDAL